MRPFILFMMLLLASIGSAYAEKTKVASMYGAGNDSCGQFLSAISEHPSADWIESNSNEYASHSAVYSEWLFAYITAFNQFNNQNININLADRAGMMYWVKNYCEKHPLSPASDAAWQLVIFQGKFDVRKLR